MKNSILYLPIQDKYLPICFLYKMPNRGGIGIENASVGD